MFKLKRTYEKPSRTDGFRVLVERLWPRGVTKERAKLDLWLKDVAPSRAAKVVRPRPREVEGVPKTLRGRA